MTPTLELSQSPLEQLRTITPQEFLPLLTRYRLMPQLLGESIIEQAISSISCTPDETTQACQEFYQPWGLTSEAKQQEWQTQYGLTQDQVEQLATRDLRVGKFVETTWGHRLEAYFLKHKHKLDQVTYSLLRVSDIGMASELYFRIQEGEQSFAELSRQYSVGPEAQTGGVLGPFEFGNLNPELAKLLYTVSVGEVQPPIEFGEVYALVRVEERIVARLDEAMRQRLLQENFNAWFQAQLAQLSESDQVWLGVVPSNE